MSEIPKINPSNTLDTNDPGDDVLRRFRYQAAYAAIIALELLDENSELEEIFCEHHEDTLVKKKDGTFIGIQVKTRAPGKELFKSNDQQIRNALKRFIEHEITYPNCYSRFVIATNYAFWDEKPNTKSLRYITQLAKDLVTSKPVKHKAFTAYVKELVNDLNAGNGNSVTHDIAITVLSKVEIADKDLPKFDDVESRLATYNIREFYNIKGARIPDLLKAAKALIDKMLEASSLPCVSAKQMYFALLANPEQARSEAIIEGKRITRETVEQILREILSEEALLRTDQPVSLYDLPKGMRKLELKMAKGGISFDNITRAKALKNAYEAHLSKWIYKYSDTPQKAINRYKQLRLIVGNECQEVYDILSRKGDVFGQEMLIEVRKRLRERWQNEPDLFFDCKYEHLLGVTGFLTELCEVWWSERFEIPEESMP